MKHEETRDQKKHGHVRWVLRIFFVSLALSAVLSLCSSMALEGAGLLTAAVVLLFFIALGIGFDIVGVAVTAADAKPFHSMASHRTKGAKESIRLLENADKVASFCNDVVGDICGIVSGSTAAVIVAYLQQSAPLRGIVVSTAVTALISGLTIGGKAIGKQVAIRKSKNVVYFVGKLLDRLHIGKR